MRRHHYLEREIRSGLSIVASEAGRIVRSWKRAPLVLGSVLALVTGLGAGSSYAYFKSTGAGNGSAAAGTLQPVSATVGSPTNPLFPGGAAGDVALTVKNPNSFAVTLTSVTGNGTITASGGIGTCNTTGVSFAGFSGNISITAVNGGTQTVDLPAKASMSSSSQNGCQGATFTIPVSLTDQFG